MSKGDQLVDHGADRVQKLADQAAVGGGMKSKLARPLADDAAFLRKLKPSLIAARLRGEAPTDSPPGSGTLAPSGPQLGPRPKSGRNGPNPFVIAAAAFALGVVAARLLDWRGHAHPRD